MVQVRVRKDAGGGGKSKVGRRGFQDRGKIGERETITRRYKSPRVTERWCSALSESGDASFRPNGRPTRRDESQRAARDIL